MGRGSGKGWPGQGRATGRGKAPLRGWAPTGATAERRPLVEEPGSGPVFQPESGCPRLQGAGKVRGEPRAGRSRTLGDVRWHASAQRARSKQEAWRVRGPPPGLQAPHAARGGARSRAVAGSQPRVAGQGAASWRPPGTRGDDASGASSSLISNSSTPSLGSASTPSGTVGKAVLSVIPPSGGGGNRRARSRPEPGRRELRQLARVSCQPSLPAAAAAAAAGVGGTAGCRASCASPHRRSGLAVAPQRCAGLPRRHRSCLCPLSGQVSRCL